MEGADRDRSARVAPATAGTLDAAAQTPGKPAAGTDPGRPPGRWRRWLNWMAARPRLTQAALLLGFIIAGVAVTWPLATHLGAGRLPSTRDSASYVWGFWWMA